MVPETRLAPTRDRALALGAAVLVHGAVLFLLVWRLGAAPFIAEAPTMNVQLTRPLHSRAPVAKRSPQPAREAGGLAAPRTAPFQILPAPERNAAPGDIAQPLAGRDGDVRRVLRALLGCEHARLAALSAEERERCLDQMTEAGANEPGSVFARLNLDVRGAYGKDPQPYLNRRPKKGCKARAAGDVTPAGQEGPTAGIDCAWSF